ncbi:probable xyloglucan endotransglucosylase/hydrolase protein 26 [Salvia miltiorrhiza]|uniref:probable xyloglucan endotransglucosylase/hydrolase protein 26 n=1 Tax=Salvia miltiorrhiza TaxID=226208 RepID=UPI0025AC612B|nr:probable xyloglucan endotransglucosylase/hydrolase protein 26 [Salvia miltiorrhiza]
MGGKMADLEFVIAMAIIFGALNSNLIEGRSMLKSMHLSWGTQRSGFLQPAGRDDVTLVLDPVSGSGIQSKDQFLFGTVEMQMKLVPGDSAGTVTSFYLSSLGAKHNEIDFEFLGNVSGQPYIIHTNIYTQGAAGREVQFYPWFDPSKDYHNYTIHWTPSHVVWLVDKIPIRVYKNYLEDGIPYPDLQQPMRAYSSIWNADSWATRGGLDRINWSKAPFIAKLRKFRARACRFQGTTSVAQCSAAAAPSTTSQLTLDAQNQMELLRNKSLIYDYCQDYDRYKGLFPGECFKPQY